MIPANAAGPPALTPIITSPTMAIPSTTSGENKRRSQMSVLDLKSALGASPTVSTRSSTNSGVSAQSDGATRSSRLEQQPSSCFTTKGGKKHHAFPGTQAPYPLSYERDILDLYVLCLPSPRLRSSFSCNRDVLDASYISQLKGSHSFVNYPSGKTPTRSLDLGCGVRSYLDTSVSHLLMTVFSDYQMGSECLKFNFPASQPGLFAHVNGALTLI